MHACIHGGMHTSIHSYTHADIFLLSACWLFSFVCLFVVVDSLSARTYFTAWDLLSLSPLPLSHLCLCFFFLARDTHAPAHMYTPFRHTHTHTHTRARTHTHTHSCTDIAGMCIHPLLKCYMLLIASLMHAVNLSCPELSS